MIDAGSLLTDLQAELGRLVADLNTRVREDGDVRARLETEWRSAFNANRTGRTFEEWAEDRLTQVAVAWLLAGVFVRFCEDNGLIDEARIAGVGVKGAEARDAQQRYFTDSPNSNDREYLQSIFRVAATLRGLGGILGEGESPLWLVDPPADSATRLFGLFRATRESGDLICDFTDPEMDTRFLGDLYQDLSTFARDTYALLQTPDFVEEFILDRTLTPAIEIFGLANTTLIDPTCGSGHFLLGAFQRMFEAWRAAEPGASEREHAGRALAAVTGVDLNPFAASIAKFRLLVAALKASHVARLADAPAFEIDVAVGDSLLWGARPGQFKGMEEAATSADRQFLYRTEHGEILRRIFDRKYAAVVGNPPYIVCRDPVLNQQYRDRYQSCHRQYSLGVPFTEKFFDLAVQSDSLGRSAGFMGMITTNSFMKREFGKKLIEQFIPTWDLTHVVDTSGAYIPGHGTPTVVLFGRHQAPVAPAIRTVMGIRGEPSTPSDPAKGLVWAAILAQIDEPDSEGAFVSVSDTERVRFATHPWSIGGGGAAELRDRLEQIVSSRLAAFKREIGRTAHTGEDGAYLMPESAALTRRWISQVVPMVEGEEVRDYILAPTAFALFPYTSGGIPVSASELPPSIARRFWELRTVLRSRLNFGQTNEERGLSWFEYTMWFPKRFSSPFSIVFADIATHNHFVLDRGGKVFSQKAPVIKLRTGAEIDEHLALIAWLNSSTACFWMKQIFFNKGASTDSSGAPSKRHRSMGQYVRFRRYKAPTASDPSQQPSARPGHHSGRTGDRARHSPAVSRVHQRRAHSTPTRCRSS